MAELKITIGNLTASKGASDANATRVLEGYLHNYCKRNNLDYSGMSNPKKADLLLTALIKIIVDEATHWYLMEAQRIALETVAVEQVVFE